VNIIADIVKPKISPFSREIRRLMSQSEDSLGEIDMTLDLVPPKSKMDDDHISGYKT
jgi:hypothetical protein